ncbi:MULTISPECIES: carbohydrate ABC transporter permease [Streptomyces]|jgi:multiple sugar transport system permease protein|uniref:Sugar ABC transporter permease n=1 Tax=Streptomyces spinosisporus TaxID=2927582 RepID=A0ABS9XJA0_9ACTN|nr:MULTISPECIES: sugar ABC transporter permease [Streptomyces]MCI3242088.1 sugar ABC transporter permease [Streptomyces spinosisporus]WUB34152.1 sugar ABC transporter permease [Streptomyces sp. NBC_00588]
MTIARVDRPRRAPTAAGRGGADAPSLPRRYRRRSRLTALAFVTPLLAYLAAFYLYPLYRNLDLSLRDYTVRSFVAGDAPFTGWDNVQKVLDDPTFGPAMRHTMVFTFVSIAFQYAIGLALAVFFNRHFRLSTVLRALFLIPWLLPLIVSASTWSWMFNSESGVVNYFLHFFGADPVGWLTSPDWALTSVIVANIWIGIPFNLVILYSGLQNIPAELYEAAALDGAGAWQQFRRITFPLLRPVSAITLLLGLVYTLKVFDLIWIMTKGGPGDASSTLATWSYQLGFGTLLPKFGPGAAVGNILILIALVFGLAYIRVQRRQET